MANCSIPVLSKRTELEIAFSADAVICVEYEGDLLSSLQEVSGLGLPGAGPGILQLELAFSLQSINQSTLPLCHVHQPNLKSLLFKFADI